MHGQLVIGPPGAGKSTYCKAMKEFLTGLKRKCALINLDPANEVLPYVCEIDLRRLITVADAMKELRLGPNGALIYCMEHLNANVDWLLDELRKLSADGYDYVLFDLPGQVELYTNYDDVRTIVGRLQKESYQLVSVMLVDSHYCSDPCKFISVLMTALATMVQMETPHINVLSKIDLLEQYGQLPLNLEYFCEVLDLDYLLRFLDEDPFTQKYRKLSEAICGVVEDYSLVSFLPLNVNEKASMMSVLREADKANGHFLRDADEQELTGPLVHAADRYKSARIQTLYEKYSKN